MAGVKGRSGGRRSNSGGPRANAGGARDGAGRKPAKPRKTKAKAYQTDDPDEFLKAVMQDPRADFKDRMAAALALKKTGKGAPVGKKEQANAKAREVIGGRSLAPMPPPSRPRLVAVK